MTDSPPCPFVTFAPFNIPICRAQPPGGKCSDLFGNFEPEKIEVENRSDKRYNYIYNHNLTSWGHFILFHGISWNSYFYLSFIYLYSNISFFVNPV